MKKIMHKTLFVAFFIIVSLINCRKRGELVRTPRAETKATEFHYQPAKFIPWFYGNLNSRGVDRSNDVSDFSRVGGGLGLLFHSQLNEQWIGHRFFYYYIDTARIGIIWIAKKRCRFISICFGRKKKGIGKNHERIRFRIVISMFERF